MKRTLCLVVGALALIATPGMAQQHQHGQERPAQAGGMAGMQGGMMMQMMHEHGVVPAIILGASQVLNLTEAQVSELGAIQQRAKEEHDRHMAARGEARNRARQLMTADEVALDQYQAALQEAADHQVLGHLAMTRSAVEARAVLNAEQKQRLDDALALMHSLMPSQGMGGGMGGMGGSGGGMNHGGSH
jgi:hypothetical protein